HVHPATLYPYTTLFRSPRGIPASGRRRHPRRGGRRGGGVGGPLRPASRRGTRPHLPGSPPGRGAPRRPQGPGPGASRDPDVAGRPEALSGGEAGAPPAAGGPARGGGRVVHPGAEAPARGGHRLPQGDVAGDRLARAAGLPSARSPSRRIPPVKRLTALTLATALGLAAC